MSDPSGWINVEYKLPEEGVDIFATDGFKTFADVLRYEGDDWWFDSELEEDSLVTQWKPIKTGH